MNAHNVLKLIHLTEKANKLSSTLGQYTFEVFSSATKHTVAQAVEETFKVTVKRVNIMNIRGKNKKSRKGQPSMTSDYKKAIVTLKAGDKIELV
jgi:large subunit ribosomal protein L23